MHDTEIPNGYMMNSQGALIPEHKVKPAHKLEDDLVRRLTSGARALNETLTTFKSVALSEVAALRDLVAQEYAASLGGPKGNMTLKSYDGAFEVQVAVSDRISFGPELQAAKSLIDSCLRRWSEGANENLHAVVNDAFNVGKTGKIDTKRVLGLRRLDIVDPEWLAAMEAISDAVRTDCSVTYVRFYAVDRETGNRTAIPLDLATV